MYRLDGYENVMLGGRRKQRALDHDSAAMMYASGGLYARIVDMPADVALSRGIEIEGDTEQIVQDELRRLKVAPRLADCARWARLSGGSALLVLTDDNAGLDAPLPESFGSVIDLRVIEENNIAVAPGGYYSDPKNERYGQVELYEITIPGGALTSRVTVHETRLIPFPGAPLPRQQRVGVSRIPWVGRSAVARAYNAIDHYLESLSLSREVLRRKQQAVHKMHGLADALDNDFQGQNEANIRKRVDMVDDIRSLTNGVTVDAEDDYTVIDLNLSGIPEVINDHRINISAEAGIAAAILFDRVQGGLANAGSSELESLYDLAEGLQRSTLTPGLEKLVRIILQQTGIRAGVDKWAIEWPSLWTPTDAEAAETDLKRSQAAYQSAQAAQAASDMGAVQPEQVTNWFADLGLFNAEHVALPDGDSDE